MGVGGGGGGGIPFAVCGVEAPSAVITVTFKMTALHRINENALKFPLKWKNHRLLRYRKGKNKFKAKSLSLLVSNKVQ